MAERVVGLRIELNGFKGVVTNIKQLEDELKKAKEDLQELEIGGTLFNQLTGEISRAEGQLMNLRKASEGIGLEKQLEGYGKLAGGITSSFAAAQAAVQLFGVESTAVSEAAAQAQNVLTLALSARGIQEVGVGASIVARTVAEKAATAATLTTNKALKALYLTISTNPIGALVTAIGLLVTAAIAFNSETEKSIDVQRELGKVTSDEANKLKIYTDVLQDANSTNEARKEAIEELNKIYPGFNALIDDENRLTKEGVKFTNLKIQALTKEAQARMLVQKIAENENKILEIQNRTVDESLGFWDKAQGVIGQVYYGNLGKSIIEVTAAVENNGEETKKLTDENEKLQKALNEVLDSQGQLDKGLSGTNKKLKDQADAEKNLDKNTNDANKATKEQIALQKQLENQLAVTDKEWETTLKLIQDLVKTTEVQTPEPKILQDLQKVIDARKQLEEKTLADVFKDLGFVLTTTNDGLIKTVDLSAKLTDNFGILYDEFREDLGGNATKSIEEFGAVADRILKKATAALKEDLISPESFDSLKQIIDQYTQFNKLVQVTPDVAKVFDPTSLNEFFNATKQILISTGDITTEYDETTRTFSKAKVEVDNLNDSYKKQDEIITNFKNKLIESYTAMLIEGDKVNKQAILNANLTEEQKIKLLESAEKGTESLKATIEELAKTQAEGIKTLVTTIATEEDDIRSFFERVNKLREGAALSTTETVKNAILANTSLLIQETQKVNGIVVNERKTALQNLQSVEQQLLEKGIDITQYTEEEKLKIVQAYLDAQVAATKKAEQEKRDEQKVTLEDVQKGLQIISQTLTDVASIAAQNFQLQLDILKYNYEEDMNNIVGQTEEANAKRIELERIYQAEKKKIEKEAQLTALRFTFAQAVAQGAQAVINALATIPPPANAIVAGVQAVVTAAQLAVISKQINFVQNTMRRGGSLKSYAGGGGLAMGPSHEQGGIYVGGGSFIEGNEAIINRQSSLQYSGLLSQINQAGGGRPIIVGSPMDSRLVEAIAKQKTEPIRAYVLEQDISRSQAINRRLEQLASF